MPGISGVAGVIVWLILMVALVQALLKRRTSLRGRIGPGASGAFYEMLNQDKRNAVELIVEQRTADRDPEDKDGDLPQLGGTRRHREEQRRREK